MDWKTKLRTIPRGERAEHPRPVESDPTVTLQSERTDLQQPIWARRYRVLRPLGEGGMGKTALAERIADGGRVCLKFLHTGTDRRAGEQECRALMRLRHESIVGLLDFSLEDSPPWLAMQYAAGESLCSYLKGRGALPPRETAWILHAIFGALEHAHASSVIHRDLKPPNIMVEESSPYPLVRVLDFGIAIVDRFDHEGRLTAQGADITGTLRYMAPEQFTGAMLTPACDIYAAGLIGWEMLMGKSPFRASTAAQMLYEKVSGPSGLDLDPLPETTPQQLRDLIKSCTQRDPALRPASAQALLSLAVILGSERA